MADLLNRLLLSLMSLAGPWLIAMTLMGFMPFVILVAIAAVVASPWLFLWAWLTGAFGD